MDVVIVLTAPDGFLRDSARLRGRCDDTIAMIDRRLGIYRDRTQPLLAHYGDLVTLVDAARDTELVHEDIIDKIRYGVTSA